jgi:RNA polymerase sigma-70 factor (ECF subfamily)
MEQSDPDPRLSRITTQWDIIFQAHADSPEEAAQAQAALVRRYGGAVRRYLLGALHDQDAAEELAQEFALRFLRGDFQRADPSRGRFRDFLKRALRNLMIDHLRRRRAQPRPLEGAPEPAADDPATADFDRQFTSCWREELLSRAWQELASLQARSGQPYHTILRFRADNPELRSPQMADRLSWQLGKSITPGGLRQALHVARGRFLGYLLDEVRGSLQDPTDEDLEEELGEVGLLEYCRPALRRRGQGPG